MGRQRFANALHQEFAMLGVTALNFAYYHNYKWIPALLHYAHIHIYNYNYNYQYHFIISRNGLVFNIFQGLIYVIKCLMLLVAVVRRMPTNTTTTTTTIAIIILLY